MDKALTMKSFSLLQLILLLMCRLGCSVLTPQTNPCLEKSAWMVPNESPGTGNTSTSDGCKCGDPLGGIIRCAVGGKIELQIGHCMQYDKEYGMLVAACPLIKVTPNSSLELSYMTIPNMNYTEVGPFICELSNREGYLCSSCSPEHYPSPSLYTNSCIRCEGNTWVLYFLISFIPIIILLALIGCLRLRLVFPPLIGLIFFCQTLAHAAIWNSQVAFFILSYESAFSRIMKALVAIYGTLNLQFIYIIGDRICFRSIHTDLDMISLEYAKAAFPLVLIFFIFCFIKLHDHNFRPVVWLWWPFHKCSVRLRWLVSPNRSSSVMDVLAAYLFLSFKDICITAACVLTPTWTFDVHGNRVGSTKVYYNPSYDWFGEDHLKIALLSLAMIFLASLLPLLLILSSLPCFERSVHCLCRGRTQGFHFFLDAFQGCYSDGTESTSNRRFFAALYMLGHLVILITFIFGIGTKHYTLQWSVSIAIFLLMIVLFSCFRPYKYKLYNMLDTFILVTLSMAAYVFTTGLYITDFTQPIKVGCFIIVTAPILLCGAILTYKLLVLTLKRCRCREENCLRFFTSRYCLLLLWDKESSSVAGRQLLARQYSANGERIIEAIDNDRE